MKMELSAESMKMKNHGIDSKLSICVWITKAILFDKAGATARATAVRQVTKSKNVDQPREKYAHYRKVCKESYFKGSSLI